MSCDSGGVQLKTVNVPLSEYNRLKDAQAKLIALEQRASRDRERLRDAGDARNHLDRALEGAFLSIICTLDNLERGMAAAKRGVGYEGIIEGLDLIVRKIRDYLSSEKIEEVPTLESGFDPSIHEILPEERGKTPPGAIVARCQRSGWTRNGRVLRKAFVELAPDEGLTEQ